MSEQLASLHKKGGGGDGKILACALVYAPGGANAWTHADIGISVTDPTATSPRYTLNESFCHTDSNNDIVFDKAISKVYVSGQTNATRNPSGTAVYSGLRVKKNGTIITGANVTGNSSDTAPTFTRIETSVTVGDVISVEVLRTASSGFAIPIFVNLVTE